MSGPRPEQILHVFALNETLDLRHTNLTRATQAPGVVVDLPPLADWLGVEALDTSEIEVFPVQDLGDMALTDYVAAAFAPSGEIPRDERLRMDALDGSVLLVPERAMTGRPAPHAHATLIASIPLTAPDHRAEMPKAPASPLPQPDAPQAARRAPVSRRGVVVIILLMILVAAGLAWIWP